MIDTATRHDRNYMVTILTSAEAAEKRRKDALVLEVAAEVCDSSQLPHTSKVLRDLATDFKTSTPPSRYRYLLQCADNPARYLGRIYNDVNLCVGYGWVDEKGAEECLSAEDADQWRAMVDALYPKLGYSESNVVIVVRRKG